MTDHDLDDFIAWLQAAGARRDQLARYRDGAALVLRHVDAGQTVGQRHVDAAIETARRTGASEQRLINLGRIGAQMMIFVADRELPPLPPPPLPVTLPPPMTPTTAEWLPPSTTSGVDGAAGDQATARVVAPTVDLFADLAPAATAIDPFTRPAPAATDADPVAPWLAAPAVDLPIPVEPSAIAVDDGPRAAPPLSAATFAPPGEFDGSAPSLELAEVERGTSRRARLARLSQASADDGTTRGTMVDDLAPAPPPTIDPSARPATIPPIAPLAPTSTERRPTIPPTPVVFSGPRPGVLASRPGSLVDHKPLPGCKCQRRAAVEADDAWRRWGTTFVAVTAALGVLLTLQSSLALALGLCLGVIALGALFTTTTVGWRCAECHRSLERYGLDDTQRRDVKVRITTFAALGAGLGLAAVLLVMKVRADAAEQRRAQQALEQLEREAPTR